MPPAFAGGFFFVTVLCQDGRFAVAFLYADWPTVSSFRQSVASLLPISCHRPAPAGNTPRASTARRAQTRENRTSVVNPAEAPNSRRHRCVDPPDPVERCPDQPDESHCVSSLSAVDPHHLCGGAIDARSISGPKDGPPHRARCQSSPSGWHSAAAGAVVERRLGMATPWSVSRTPCAPRG